MPDHADHRPISFFLYLMLFAIVRFGRQSQGWSIGSGTNLPVVRLGRSQSRWRSMPSSSSSSNLSSSASTSSVATTTRTIPRLLFGKISCTATLRAPTTASSAAMSGTITNNTELIVGADDIDVDGTTNHVTKSSTRRASKRGFVDFPFTYHQELTLTIEALTNRGWGLGRVELPLLQQSQVAVLDEKSMHSSLWSCSAQKPQPQQQQQLPQSSELPESTNPKRKRWVVMVAPGVIPGETVRVRIFRNHPNYSEADLMEIIHQPRPEDRVEPPCPVFLTCGGCQYQHMSIALQREWKTRHVQEALAQYGIHSNNVTLVAQCIGTDHLYGYRSKLTPHYDAPKQRPSKNKRQDAEDGSTSCPTDSAIPRIGFKQQTFRHIVDVEHCVIATDPINTAYRALRDKLMSSTITTTTTTTPSSSSSSPPKRQKGATLLLRQANLHDDYVETRNNQNISTTVLGNNFTYMAGNFFQNNYHILGTLVEYVVNAAFRSLSDEEDIRPRHLVDCYCGSGLFSISAASQFKTVIGIEINAKAVLEATLNAARNSVTNCQFIAADAEHIFKHLRNISPDETSVVLDPSRKGCSISFLSQLLDFAPARIVYVSCDPVTQAHDVSILIQDNVYEILQVQPFDLFPQTRHIECLMVLNRRRSRPIIYE